MVIWSSFFLLKCASTTVIYTLSLHDALPISSSDGGVTLKVSSRSSPAAEIRNGWVPGSAFQDRKSTRLNSSHTVISYAVFCLKKKFTERATSLTQTCQHLTDDCVAVHLHS